RTRREHLDEIRSAIGELFEVVEEQKLRACGKLGAQRLARIGGAAANDDRLGDTRVQAVAVPRLDERYHEYTIGEEIARLTSDFQREASLSDSSRSVQRDESRAVALEQPEDASDGRLASDQRRERHRNA